MRFKYSNGTWYELYLQPYKNSTIDSGIYLCYYDENGNRINLWQITTTWLQ